MNRLLNTAAAALLALSGAVAHAQSVGDGGQTAVPVWNSSNGKLEAVLLIDNAAPEALLGERRGYGLGARWHQDTLAVDTNISAARDGVGLLCRGGALSSDCLVTELGNAPAPSRLQAETGVQLGRGRISALAGQQRMSAGEVLGLDITAPATRASALGQVASEQRDIGIVGELKLGQQGWVRVGGGVARARLVSANSFLPGALPPQWNSRNFSVGGGYGAIGGEVVGRVVNVPGHERYGTLGLGLTWRTPWQGRLTVGAQNLIRRGENPLSPDAQPGREEGAVPYVRYQQDL